MGVGSGASAEVKWCRTINGFVDENNWEKIIQINQVLLIKKSVWDVKKHLMILISERIVMSDWKRILAPNRFSRHTAYAHEH